MGVGGRGPGGGGGRFADYDDEYFKQKRKLPESTWKQLGWKSKILRPYLWPRGDRWMQMRIVLCVSLLLSVRGVNVLVPMLSKEIINGLNEPGGFPWRLIVYFMCAKFLQGGSGGGAAGRGLLNNLQSLLWIRVQQFTTRELKLRVFSHIHSLGLRWHQSRKTGEVLRIMDRGVQSVTSLLNLLFFSIFPILIDITIALAYLSSGLSALIGVFLLITMIIYLAVTIFVTEFKTRYRRDMNLADNKQRAKCVDSLLNAETVKYFNAEQFEHDQYRTAIADYQGKAWISTATLNLLNFLQNVVITLGFLSGYLYCAHLVSKNKLTVGDYVLFGTYMTQLLSPLNMLGSLYR